MKTNIKLDEKTRINLKKCESIMRRGDYPVWWDGFFAVVILGETENDDDNLYLKNEKPYYDQYRAGAIAGRSFLDSTKASVENHRCYEWPRKDLLGDFGGIALALFHRGKMDEWNECLSKLYMLADNLETDAIFEKYPEWTYDKARRLKRLICEFPHVSSR